MYGSVVSRFPAINRATKAAILREEVRASIPVSKYVLMLHEAAVTGRLPDVDPVTGKPKGTWTDLSAKDRLDVMKYLINKVIPDKPEPTAPAITPEDLDKLTPDQLANLPHEELVRVLQMQGVAAKPVDAEVIKDG